MLKSLTCSFFALALFAGAAQAQSAAELNVRMSRIEDQMRRLMGQIEELGYQMRETQAQIAKLGTTGRNLGAVEAEQPAELDVAAAPAAKPRKQKLTAANVGVEEIEGGPEPMALDGEEFTTVVIKEDGTEETVTVKKAPGPKILGTLPGSGSADTGDGGFQGEVIVPSGADDSTVETVALGASPADTPEILYERSYESLLRRQFGEAEGGFRTFLQKHREHSLAGNAQYWLGETHYVQGDYRQAAQSFLTGFQEFPKGRKAADSLLKLGLSLNRLGQKQQACAALGAVPEKFPKAAEAKKRASTESKRAGC